MTSDNKQWNFEQGTYPIEIEACNLFSIAIVGKFFKEPMRTFKVHLISKIKAMKKLELKKKLKLKRFLKQPMGSRFVEILY